MKKLILSVCTLMLCGLFMPALAQSNSSKLPWSHGKLMVSKEKRYLMNEDGTPFFWLADTGWLLPERLNRDEASFYLGSCSRAGFNVVQVQTLNAVPSINCYGQYSMTDGYNFKNIDKKGVYGYWNHMDYIIQTAERNGIYIAMVCIWGSQVKSGAINAQQAQAYGKFLGERYKNNPNIIWVIGGDVRGDVHPEVFESLAHAIKSVDKNHLMTFHPFGRTSSVQFFNAADWLDFNMFQSGHRRYGQTKGDGDFSNKESLEEDNWRFVEQGLGATPLKPILDAEPSYEDIPQGLHDPAQPHWKDYDVRRYAYWSVFAGSCGHTYGHNNIMQFAKPGVGGAYGADGDKKPWYKALLDPGYNQMQYLKCLMVTFPYFDRVPDQSVICGQNGERYNRIIATRGNDYLLVYNYSGRPMELDLRKISGEKKNVWWFNPKDGSLEYVGEFNNQVSKFSHDGAYGDDRVLIAVDFQKNYVQKDWKTLSMSLNER